MLQQGRSPLGQCLGKARGVIFQDIEDAVQGMEFGEDCVELCPCLSDLPDEASQGRGRFRNRIVGRKARRRDGSVKDGELLLVPRRRLNQASSSAVPFVPELHETADRYSCMQRRWQ